MLFFNLRIELQMLLRYCLIHLTLKRLDEGGGGVVVVNLTPPPCGLSKHASSKERVKLWFFVAFNIIISHIFPEEDMKPFRRYEDFFCQY